MMCGRNAVGISKRSVCPFRGLLMTNDATKDCASSHPYLNFISLFLLPTMFLLYIQQMPP